MRSLAQKFDPFRHRHVIEIAGVRTAPSMGRVGLFQGHATLHEIAPGKETGEIDHSLRLSDGRRLSYRLYGDPAGRAVMALHGTPGSRLKFSLAHREAQRLGLCLVSPDRWGYGASDLPQGALSLRAYALDILQLADALSLKRFGVVGISGGGPFATAIATELGERIGALALVAPVSPLTRDEHRRGVTLFHRFAFRGLPRLPGAIPLAFLYFQVMLRYAPAMAVRAMASRAGAPDRVLLKEPSVAEDLVRMFQVGLAGGVRGPAADMRLFSRDWEIDLAAISCPGRLWLGTADRNVPVTAARHLAGVVPGMDLVEIPDGGHFWITKGYPEVLAWLSEALHDKA